MRSQHHSNRLPQARTEELVVSELGGELLVYDLRIHEGFCLNGEAARVWQALDGHRTVESLAAHIGADVDVVRFALERLAKADLLDGDLPSDIPALMPRRELMRKLLAAGVGAAALPVVMTFAVPTAAAAASIHTPQCVPGNTTDLSENGCPCTANAECQGVCPVDPGNPRYCLGGPDVGPFCAPGTSLNLSADGCPCALNEECSGVCPVSPSPRTCLT